MLWCLSWSVLSDHTHTAPRWKPLKPSTVANRMRGKVASWEGASTLHPCWSLLPPLWSVWQCCHMQGQHFAFTVHMCKSLHKAKHQVPAPWHQVCDSEHVGLWWHSLEKSNAIKTQHGCSDTLCVSWCSVDETEALYGKRVCVGWHSVIEGMERDCSLIKILIPSLTIFLARSAACMFFFWFCELSGLTVVSSSRNARKSS